MSHVATAALLACALAGASTAPERRDLRTFFAFEREIWDETEGALLAPQRPVRHRANPVLRRGSADAIDGHRIDIATVLPEGRRLRAWYGAIRSQAPGKRLDLASDLSVGYAESEDGIRWVKPKLDLGERGTNMVLGGGAYMTVAADTERGGGYRGLVAFFRPDVGTPGAEPGATFELVRSMDGFRWDFEGKPSATLRHFEAYGLFRRDGRWWVLGQGVPPYLGAPGSTRRVMYAFHSEGTKQMEIYPRPLLAYPGNRSFPDASPQTHVGAGIWDRGRTLLGISGHFWPGGFGATAGYSIGLIYSHDGIAWTEPFPATPLLAPGPPDAWDRGWVLQTQRPVSRGDRTYIFYVGADGGNEWSAHADLGLAVVRRDGFAAYKPEGASARLVTRPIEVLPGETTLYLNARGPIVVQVLDPYLRPAGATATVRDGGVRVPVLDLGGLRLSRVRMSFDLGPGAELYTFSLGPPDSALPPLDDWE